MQENMLISKVIKGQWDTFLLVLISSMLILFIVFNDIISPITEEVQITALGEPGVNASSSEVHLFGYKINGLEHELVDTPEVIIDGNWAWYGCNGQFYSWLPMTNSNREEKNTNSISLELPVGRKSLIFLADVYCGMVQIEYDGRVQIYDTSIVGNVELGNSPLGLRLKNSLYYIAFYIALVIVSMLAATLFMCFISLLLHRVILKSRIGLIRLIVFIMLFSIIAYPLQLILSAKFSEDGMNSIDGFYAEKEDDIDVVFLGASAMFCSVDPIILYKEFGIGSYDFGSSSQDMYITYLFMQEMFRTQSPKLVVLECGATFNEPGKLNEIGMRMGLTSIKFSLDKLACIYRSVGGINSEFMTYLFPILKYKSRWQELGEFDVYYPFSANKFCATKGYLQTEAITKDKVNLAVPVGEDEEIPAENIKMMRKMIELCKRNGAELLFMKAPVPIWSSTRCLVIDEFAYSYSIHVIDYVVNMNDLELNSTTDFRNEGHVNDLGARKITLNLGQYLVENYDLPDRRNDEEENTWDKSLKMLNVD